MYIQNPCYAAAFAYTSPLGAILNEKRDKLYKDKTKQRLQIHFTY
jgi:hypothetical protein